jgi:hypothetical protein
MPGEEVPVVVADIWPMSMESVALMCMEPMSADPMSMATG